MPYNRYPTFLLVLKKNKNDNIQKAKLKKSNRIYKSRVRAHKIVQKIILEQFFFIYFVIKKLIDRIHIMAILSFFLIEIKKLKIFMLKMDILTFW